MLAKVTDTSDTLVRVTDTRGSIVNLCGTIAGTPWCIRDRCDRFESFADISRHRGVTNMLVCIGDIYEGVPYVPDTFDTFTGAYDILTNINDIAATIPETHESVADTAERVPT